MNIKTAIKYSIYVDNYLTWRSSRCGACWRRRPNRIQPRRPGERACRIWTGRDRRWQWSPLGPRSGATPGRGDSPRPSSRWPAAGCRAIRSSPSRPARLASPCSAAKEGRERRDRLGIVNSQTPCFKTRSTQHARGSGMATLLSAGAWHAGVHFGCPKGPMRSFCPLSALNKIIEHVDMEII